MVQLFKQDGLAQAKNRNWSGKHVNLSGSKYPLDPLKNGSLWYMNMEGNHTGFPCLGLGLIFLSNMVNWQRFTKKVGGVSRSTDDFFVFIEDSNPPVIIYSLQGLTGKNVTSPYKQLAIWYALRLISLNFPSFWHCQGAWPCFRPNLWWLSHVQGKQTWPSG